MGGGGVREKRERKEGVREGKGEKKPQKVPYIFLTGGWSIVLVIIRLLLCSSSPLCFPVS